MAAPLPSDLIDSVDDSDRVVGTVERGQAIGRGANFRTVHVVAVGPTPGDILLSRVGSSGTRSPGRWSSTVAGYLYAGEPPQEGAGRRLYEEVGLTTALTYRGRARMDDNGSTKFIYVFSTEVESMPTIREPGHVDRLEFRSIDLVRREVVAKPDAFTSTFPFVLDVIGRGTGGDLDG